VELADKAELGDRRVLHVDVTGGRISGRDSAVAVRPLPGADEWLRLEIDGQVHAGLVLAGRHRVQVAYRGQSYVFDRPDAFGPSSRAADSDGVIAAPMPGTVLAVHVSVGEGVQSGAALGVLEAMKMELVLKAPFDGTVAEVNATAGDSVDLGKRLFAVEAGGDA
jgi:3-methylcrotonyl-CoA carboxylase alpha subunit/acetyl-CoA/propionyl-CoA carboxylase biotin carboxyl carrier protein